MVEQIDAGVEQLIADNGTPQLEDGHTRIANELLEAIISFDFSKRQYKVVLFVLRKTYGWNKKADVMSLSQIMEGTGLDRANCSRTLAELGEMKVLLKQQQAAGNLVELNKKYKQWVVLPNQQPVAKTATKVLPKRQFAVVEMATTKDTTKRQLKTRENFSLPEFIPADAWEGFVSMRNAIKKPMTDRAITIALNKLKAWHEAGFSVAAILDQSTFNRWQDLYAPKDAPAAKQTPRRKTV
jgi:phage replication O-like protein O